MLNKQFFTYGNEAYGDDGLNAAMSAGSILGANEEAQNEGFLPEKYQVLKEDGTVDLEQSARKLSEGYSHLERRLGTGDVPPRSPEEYQVDFNSEVYSFEDFKQEPENIEFLSKAHELGMTQKQVEFVLSEYANRLPELVQAGKELDIEGAHQALSDVWRTEGEFNQNLRTAYQAFQRYAAPEDLAHIDQIGNNPIVIKMLANIGKAFQEDIGISRASGFQQQDIRQVMSSDAYRNPNHPDHKATHERIKRYYESTYGNQPIG
ncbi:hypothetical protein DKL61_10445 [Gammaproteobacteria bacterium ESL0073]|nr:hypothetical protein DKL61_10445 [Gammaproteobacteria bacterium ESL0073]